MPQILPYLLCSALYAIVAVLLARTVSRPDRAAFPEARVLHLGTALPLTLQAILLARSVFADEIGSTSFTPELGGVTVRRRITNPALQTFSRATLGNPGPSQWMPHTTR